MQNLALCLSKSPAEWNAMLQFRQINSPKPSISPTITPYLTLKKNLDPNRLILKKIGIYVCWNVCLKWNVLHLLIEGLFVGYNHLGKREWWRMEIRSRGIKPLNIFMLIIFIFSMHILNITICPPKTWKMFSQVFQQKTKGSTYLANWCKIFITIFSPIFSLWCSSLCLLCLIQINPYRTPFIFSNL